tara:strand:- start:533 stop:1963 length:1431 start_codon:yes stop_codon:yes gene_type:complete
MPILTYIDNVPLFSKVEEARIYGQSNGLQGFHKHTYKGVIGYMAGKYHASVTSAIVIQEQDDETALQIAIDSQETETIELPFVKKINSVVIDTTDMSAQQNVREITVNGDLNAEFTINILDSSEKFYDFETTTFSVGNTKNKNLKVKLQGSSFSSNIFFPAASGGDTYRVIVMANPTNTQLEGFTNKNVFNTTISQVANSTLTFTGAVSTASSSNYQAFPTITSSGSITSANNENVAISMELKNTASDGAGFGLRVIRNPIDTDWYFTTTETVDGAITSSTEVVVDDLTDIGIGTTITAVSSGSLSGTPIITAIDTNTKTLTLSSAQTFADGITLTLKAFGSDAINTAIGCNISFQNLTASSAVLEKTVRTTASGTTVNLNGTYGIAGGDHVSVTGPFIDYADGENTVTSISAASSTAGSIVMATSQAVKSGTKIKFTGSTETVTVVGGLIVKRYPSSNRTINLFLDNFITVGTES